MKNKRASNKRDKKEIKVTYISSPVKVKTSASNFRALVQELTGQYSNVAETSIPMEEDNGHSERVHRTHHHHESETQQWRVNVDEGTNLMKPHEYSEFLSRSLMEPFNQQQLLQYDLMSFDMS
ncbi:hypothetical protein AAZX31_15G218900 [Glycine max]|uniref:VQ domain-containing protein n=3 Tax=Glycine subgen. Soja TaxID=1462606 RepID=I1MIN5_SOYBN|nr:uncharacterized protein LOC100783939 [Glycine max]XP_028203508.1 uncharacterized protein LOC114387509 [Glycine soja]KAG4947317.1 hypothetical protein JHK87_043324 [Glycine soja]KAG5106575.1 hypothetical protein JHK82_043545 [Glycine max]KAH1148542.1 hypothetical protein GYH30_043256 [Glycine max]KAH1210582.1 Sigma factor binding protein 1, chloroplastic [Glycine max]KHN35295.1 hypothetical protein glysoja_039642 [Glycine soja]|eukprot:XP_003546708.1 uncharacterized protein LOC100783939 [Glycine max]